MAASAQPFASMYFFSGALVAGDDLFARNVTVSDAVALCSASPVCRGLTYKSSDPSPSAVREIYFKRHGAHANGDARWSTYVKWGEGPGNCTRAFAAKAKGTPQLLQPPPKLTLQPPRVTPALHAELLCNAA